VDAAADAEAAVKVLRHLAINLVRAAGGPKSGSGEAERAGERAYADLDQAFREWLAGLGVDSDPLTERRRWQMRVRRVVLRIGADLVAAAGPAAWAGRSIRDNNGKEIYYSSAQAEAWFRTGLSQKLPMAFVNADASQEVTA